MRTIKAKLTTANARRMAEMVDAFERAYQEDGNTGAIFGQIRPVRTNGEITGVEIHAMVFGHEHAARVQRAISSPCGDWIPVSERVPDPCVSVLVAYHDDLSDVPDADVDMGEISKDGRWRFTDASDIWFTDGAVTHWMPLPAPPEAL